MNTEVRAMLESLYGVFAEKFNCQTLAWDRFVEFLAADNHASLIYEIRHTFRWLHGHASFADKVLKVYDNKLLKSDYYDHLGEMYLEKIVSESQAKRKGLFLVSSQTADSLAQKAIPETDERLRILDPAMGTGRLLMAAHRRAPKAFLFGVDSDLRSLRIAYTNFAVHDISAYLLHADSSRHETDISTQDGKYNWGYANNWYSCMDRLRPICNTQRGVSGGALSVEKQREPQKQ